jgi:hypothetical protein
MDFEEFDHLSLDDLRALFREMVDSGPPEEKDREFYHRLANAIAEREKTFGKGPATGSK